MVTANKTTAQPENAEIPWNHEFAQEVADMVRTADSINKLIDSAWDTANIMADKGTLGSDNYTKFHEVVDLLNEIRNDLLGRE